MTTKILQNDLLIRALKRQPTERTPVWAMRQAGRYLPEYRAVRAKAGSFMGLATNPELACEVTLQPLRRFDLDAVIIFSDILTIPDAMGQGLHFVAGEGPRFEKKIETAADVAALPIPDPADSLRYVMDAINLTATTLNGQVPLLGFAGSPWTLATYMIEGGSSKTYARSKAFLLNEPQAAHQLLEKLAEATVLYLSAQIESGADAVQVFDSWGGVLSPAMYREFSLPYMKKIVQGLRARGHGETPVILFSKGVHSTLADMATTGAHALGVDWTTDLGEARRLTGDKVALQGNLDPCVLYADDAVIRQQVKNVLDAYGEGPGHVFNLGHGMHPDMQPEKLAVMVDAVHELSQK